MNLINKIFSIMLLVMPISSLKAPIQTFKSSSQWKSPSLSRNSSFSSSSSKSSEKLLRSKVTRSVFPPISPSIPLKMPRLSISTTNINTLSYNPQPLAFVIKKGQLPKDFTLEVIQKSCIVNQNGNNCLLRAIMAAIAGSKLADPYFKPTNADKISKLEDLFARLFYKYLFKAGKINQTEYSKSLIKGHRFALSDNYGREEADGFLEYLMDKGALHFKGPLKSVIVVDSVPLIEQAGFENAISEEDNIKISNFIRGQTEKLRLILLNYQIIYEDGQPIEYGDHWVYVELSKSGVRQRAISATIIDSVVVNPMKGSNVIANLVVSFVKEAVTTFGLHPIQPIPIKQKSFFERLKFWS